MPGMQPPLRSVCPAGATARAAAGAISAVSAAIGGGVMHFGVCGCCHRPLYDPAISLHSYRTGQQMHLCDQCLRHVVMDDSATISVAEACDYRVQEGGRCELIVIGGGGPH